MRKDLFLCCLSAMLLACAETPVTVVPGPRPVAIAMDVHVTVWGEGRWIATPSFDAALEQRNLHMVEPADATVTGQVDWGVWGNRRAVDVYLARDGHRTCAGRILVPDVATTPFDVVGPWIAEMLARALVSPPAAVLDAPCKT